MDGGIDLLKYLKRWGREQNGQTLAEFALVFPLMVMFLLASLEFGWYFLNYTAVTQYTRETLACVPYPRGDLYWEGGDWNDITVSPPSWMTEDELDDLYSVTYDGWISFADDEGYFNSAFEQNVSGISTILNKDQIEINSVRGGWLVAAMGKLRPMTGMRPEEYQRYAQARVYMYADIEVEVAYTFHPLTAVGQLFFCETGEDTCQIVAKERAEMDIGQNLNIGGV